MNIGLGNLSELKVWLLAEELRTETAWDAQISAIGCGVAAAFEAYCGRSFEYLVGAQEEFGAERTYLRLPRYPVQDISAVEFRENIRAEWEDILTLLNSWNGNAGIVVFTGAPGSYEGTVRVTWTGGYWYDTSEDGSGVKPAGARALPADLKLAWLQHCRATWAQYPKLGTPVNTVSQAAALATMPFSPEVTAVLQSYRRLTLS